jgi:hypothetical protein
MATYIAKNLKTSEQRTYTGKPDRGDPDFAEAWGTMKKLEQQLNTCNLPGPWRVYIQGETEPTTCPHCGQAGPF